MIIKPTCPHCGKLVEMRDKNDFFPFCSKRCRLIDLGSWLTEEYCVPGHPMELADENPSEPELLQ